MTKLKDAGIFAGKEEKQGEEVLEVEEPEGFKSGDTDGNGGDCVAAAQIYNMPREYEGKVTVKIDGIAASVTSVIAMAGDTVLMSPVSMMMIHNPMTIAFGDSGEMQRAIDMLKSVKDFDKLFHLEKEIKKKHKNDFDAIKAARLEKEKPVLEGFWAWFEKQHPTKGTRMDNSDTVAGADASATIYSLVETAKANVCELSRYFYFNEPKRFREIENWLKAANG